MEPITCRVCGCRLYHFAFYEDDGAICFGCAANGSEYTEDGEAEAEERWAREQDSRAEARLIAAQEQEVYEMTHFDEINVEERREC